MLNTYPRQKPKPAQKVKVKRKKQKTNRQKLLNELSNLCREITIWRDGCTCVLSNVDGGRCNSVSQWGHVIPQGGSGYLRHSLSNSFRQCASHNLIHDKINPLIYLNWYRRKFGNKALDMLETESLKPHHKITIPELWQMRDNLRHLLDMRHAINGATIEQLVEAGYYGDIIREAWVKEGRI